MNTAESLGTVTNAQSSLKNANYWKEHYVTEMDAEEIERNIKLIYFVSGGKKFELLYFEKGKDAPNILISQGSAGHSYVFAELSYLMHLQGYNVFIMPKHGGPEVSIIRNLLNQGFDMYAADWGTPGRYDKEPTVGHYVNSYLDSSVDHIRKHTNSEKVSILGYCWGGDLALMYAALHPEKVANVVTLATPGDFSLDDGLLALWTRNIDADAIVEAFGNAPSMMLNTAFVLRSPLDLFHKYQHFFEKPHDLESMRQFFARDVALRQPTCNRRDLQKVCE